MTIYMAALVGSCAAIPAGLIRYRSRVSAAAGLASCVLVAVAWAHRTWEAGHIPLFGAYESALSLALAAGIALAIAAHLRRLPVLGFFPLIAAALLLHGMRYSSSIYALTISERGFWVHLHAILAFAAFALACLLVILAILVLLGHDLRLKFTLLLFYTVYALVLISGSFYEYLLFGRAWSWDPIESMNLACFLAFTTLVHVTAFDRWEVKRVARWVLLLFVLLVLAYRLILIFPPGATYHIFDIDLRLHVT